MAKKYIPERSHILWLDFEPTKGKEIGKYRPALVLSSKEYNQKTGLLICCPISTSMRGGMLEVVIEGLSKPSVVAASVIQTLSWPERKTKYIATAKPKIMKEVLSRILPLLGTEDFW